MKKVYQRLVDKYKGDCMQAAIASLLEISYEETPAFIEYTDGFFQPLFTLIKSKGYDWHGMLHNPYPRKEDIEYHKESLVEMLSTYNGVNGYFFASVYSPKYFKEENFNKATATTHAVIIDKEYNIVHDPNPENAIYNKYPMAKELGYNGIIDIFLIEKE